MKKITKHGSRRLNRRVHVYTNDKLHVQKVQEYGISEVDLMKYQEVYDDIEICMSIKYLMQYLKSKRSKNMTYMIYAQSIYVFTHKHYMLITVFKIPTWLIPHADKLVGIKRREIEEAKAKAQKIRTEKRKMKYNQHINKRANQIYIYELRMRLDPLY